RRHEIVLRKLDTSSADLIDHIKLGTNPELYINDELHARIPVGSVLNVFSQIEPEEYPDYLTNVGSEEKLIELVQNIANGYVAEEFSIRTPAIINNQRVEISKKIKTGLEHEIESANRPERRLGFRIPKVQLVDLILPEVVDDKMISRTLINIEKSIEIVAAKAKSQVTKITARASKYESIKMSEAEAIKFDVAYLGKRLLIRAEKEYGAVAKALGIEEGQFVYQLATFKETLKEVLPNSDYTFLGSSDFANMFGFMKLIQGGLTKLGMGPGVSQ
ncbi:MAG TPA: hypothetical protein VIH31_00990, partial [Candidatus Paceibacterota bacterium]